MFNQFKDQVSMLKEARAMQKQLKQQRVTGSSEDELIKITVNGIQEIEEIEIHDDLLSVENKKNVIKGIKQAMKDAQKKMQKEMMKDMDMNKLKGMLGG